MCYIDAEQVVDLCIAIVKVQRDFGNRADRKVARMKYLIHNWGLDAVHAEGRRVLRRLARAAAAGRRPRLQRRHGLARAGRRPLVLRPERRERPHQGHGDDAAEDGAARNLHDARARRCGSRRTRASSSATSHRSDRGRLERNPPPPRRAAHRGLHDRPPLVDGLPRPAHLRPGGHRKRARAADDHRPARSRAREARPARTKSSPRG